jgi:hypothetical protein
MTTNTELLDATRLRVGGMLAEHFADVIDFNDGSWAIPHGSTSVMVVVRPFTETDTVVELIAQCVTGATMNVELATWLLRKNAELHFGGFGLLFDNTVVFTYAIPGNALSAQELESAVASVAVIADHYDEEIVALGGGMRYADLDA